jgi:GTPase SAR1 family protein
MYPINYYQANVNLIFFSVVNRESFENVTKYWLWQISTYGCNPNHKILIGTHTDLRHSFGKAAISTEEGIEMAKQIDACAYFELSTKFKCGIKKPLEFAAKLVAYTITSNERKKCLVQ